MSWNYQRDESANTEFKPIPVGMHRIRIASAEKAVASTGKDMLSLKFDVSGYNSKIFHNIVFLPDKPEITNRNLTKFFDAFPGIKEGDFNTQNWVGQVGACEVEHEEYKGKTKAKVNYFVKPDKAANLPAWVEPEKKDSETTTTDNDGFLNVSGNLDDQVPF